MKRADISDLEVLAAYHDRDRHSDPWPYQILARKFGCCEKLAYRACQRACDHDLLDYGVSLRAGWITEKGQALLESAGPAKHRVVDVEASKTALELVDLMEAMMMAHTDEPKIRLPFPSLRRF